MTENDIIAEYIREKYPHMITGVDFAIYEIKMACMEFARKFEEELRNMDFSVLKELSEEKEGLDEQFRELE